MVAMLGHSGVGVTSLLNRISLNRSEEPKLSRGDELSEIFEVNGIPPYPHLFLPLPPSSSLLLLFPLLVSFVRCLGHRFQLWACVGNQRRALLTGSRSLPYPFSGLMVVYDITDADSLGEIPEFIAVLSCPLLSCPRPASFGDWHHLLVFQSNPSLASLPIMYLGNRVDEEAKRQLRPEKVLKRLNSPHALILEVSAKANINVMESFRIFANIILPPPLSTASTAASDTSSSSHPVSSVNSAAVTTTIT